MGIDFLYYRKISKIIKYFVSLLTGVPRREPLKYKNGTKFYNSLKHHFPSQIKVAKVELSRELPK